MYNIHNTYILHNTIGVETFKIKVYKLELAPTIALAMAVQATSASFFQIIFSERLCTYVTSLGMFSSFILAK